MSRSDMTLHNKIVFDFGLHEGEDTEFYLALGAQVIAFEANPDLVSRNKERFSDALADGRLTIVEGAIVSPDHVGDTVTFYLDPRKSVWGTTSPDWVRRNSGLGSAQIVEVMVPCTDLRSIVKNYPDALYAKIDIEGADRHVLSTFASVGSAPQYLSIESDKVSLDTVVAEIQELKALGYTRFAAVQQAVIPSRRLRKAGLDGRPVDYRFREHASGPFGEFLDQPYKSAAETIEDYRKIFQRYRLFGDTSSLMANPVTRVTTRALTHFTSRAFGLPLCGWYDTHAMR